MITTQNDKNKSQRGAALRWGLLIILIMAALIVFIHHLGQIEEEKPKTEVIPTVVVEPVTRQDIAITETLWGTVETLPNRDVKLAPELAGHIHRLLVKPGDWVQPGQVVAELDSLLLNAQTKQAQAALGAAEAGYLKAKHGSRPQEIMQAESAVAQNQALVDQAQAALQRIQGLYQEKIAPRKDVETAQAQFKTAVAQRNSALEQLRLVKLGPRREDRRIALEQMHEAQATYTQNLIQLAYTQVKAPIAGRVDQILVGIGASVDATMPIMRILDLSEVQVKAAASLNSINNLHLAEKVRILVDNQALTGSISYIGGAYDPTVNGFPVYILVKNQDNLLKAGMTTQDIIYCGVHPNAQVISKTALIPIPEIANRFLVYTVTADNRLHRRTVVKGQEQDSFVEIISGLRPDNWVVTQGGYGLVDNTPVHIMKHTLKAAGSHS